MSQLHWLWSQVDPLLDLLTGQEHLAMYARLKVRLNGRGSQLLCSPANPVRGEDGAHVHVCWTEGVSSASARDVQGVPEAAVRGQVVDALQRVGMPAEMSRRPAGGYSGGCVSACRQLQCLLLHLDMLSQDLLFAPGAQQLEWSVVLGSDEVGQQQQTSLCTTL
jgi:hypothetical protein